MSIDIPFCEYPFMYKFMYGLYDFFFFIYVCSMKLN